MYIDYITFNKHLEFMTIVDVKPSLYKCIGFVKEIDRGELLVWSKGELYGTVPSISERLDEIYEAQALKIIKKYGLPLINKVPYIFYKLSATNSLLLISYINESNFKLECPELEKNRHVFFVSENKVPRNVPCIVYDTEQLKFFFIKPPVSDYTSGTRLMVQAMNEIQYIHSANLATIAGAYLVLKLVAENNGYVSPTMTDARMFLAKLNNNLNKFGRPSYGYDLNLQKLWNIIFDMPPQNDDKTVFLSEIIDNPNIVFQQTDATNVNMDISITDVSRICFITEMYIEDFALVVVIKNKFSDIGDAEVLETAEYEIETALNLPGSVQVKLYEEAS